MRNRCNTFRCLAPCLMEQWVQQRETLSAKSNMACSMPGVCLWPPPPESPNRVTTINALRMMPERQCKLIKHTQPWNIQNDSIPKEFSKGLGCDACWNPETNPSYVSPKMYLCSEHNYVGIGNIAEVTVQRISSFLFLIIRAVCAKAKMRQRLPQSIPILQPKLGIYIAMPLLLPYDYSDSGKKGWAAVHESNSGLHDLSQRKDLER